ncbi:MULTISPECIES: Cof-type HAD-IIB family hydrolase [unclassified Gilliamella]|uniref:Cof-type HAD-IIB family hydrolase n=1 Tax=unclassified Gilliamella TaxID=2685620 RepID=UPI00081045E4|nr:MULTISPECIES: Cof-type HAD-IIB family hydrolase [Gilliamella]MCX8585821.1 Cof-type HAD-IIB family hydrolase [Gilliamella sp. B3562]MCX8660837.1 Cof-type HAD-IIB family hydrolase [Gilliamella sp. B2772]MCX8663006.1 Cof-type HAD-IIB family hydrolase [Gilliamella sp. B2911]MCX8674787.1 Cof-type HAD-IIB family hydrolase [Gilliamella sp. B3023]MCX8684873.1 Cof-type HAD-IIB family hydrolase [Gilliamella sp. B2864]
MIKLIITDLDGTFLNSQGDYDRTLFTQVYDLMAKQNVQFVACTGKQCERVEELFADYLDKIWIVGDSATTIKHKGEFIYRSFIENQLGQRIIKTLEQASQEHVIIACTAKGAVIKSNLPAHLKQKVRGSYATIIEVDDFKTVADDFIKITVYDEKEQCPQTRKHLTPYDNDVYIVVSEAAWIDITEHNVHKGNTIKKLQQILNITYQETMAFGDGLNDIELLEQANYSFAMRNAFDETKAVAKFITGSNNESAVMTTIQLMLALQ